MSKLQSIYRFLFFFAISWLILSLLGIGKKPVQYTDNIVLRANDSYTLGSAIEMDVYNNTDKEIKIPNNCDKTPLTVEKYTNGEWKEISVNRILKGNCVDPVTIKSKENRKFSYANESNLLFGDIGKYRISLKQEEKVFSHEFAIKAPGLLKTIWIILIFKPIFNLLIWLTIVIPGHFIGISIIITTIIVRLILLVPNHKALKSQKALQNIQPELQKIKEKYKGDQARIAQETMAVWKKHKVNPAGSCLPILLQFPVLIAVFFVLKEGFTLNNKYLLYDIIKDFDFSIINSKFIIFDITNFGPWYLALIVGGLQFFQMKLSFAKQPNTSDNQNDASMMQMKIMNKMFTYFLPIMILFFVVQLPAGVGLYWSISTIFSICQQQMINKEK